MKYPIGMQTFECIRKENLAYVDKTEFIYDLAWRGCYYYLMRPSQFGVSLLLTTMEAYFSGKKELFKGLAIEKLETEWKAHPVLHFYFDGTFYDKVEDIDNVLRHHILQWEKEYGVPDWQDDDCPLNLRFANVIKQAHKKTGERVVILVDSYDFAIQQHLDDEELCNAMWDRLNNFFVVTKGMDTDIDFEFVTGHGWLGHLSIFSGFNNLSNITTVNRYAHICGITEGELMHYFADDVAAMAAKNNMTVDECVAKLKQRYGGYRFDGKSEPVMSPYSLLRALADKGFHYYGVRMITYPCIERVIRRSGCRLPDIHEGIFYSSSLCTSDYSAKTPVPSLFQSGYFTLNRCDLDIIPTYELDYPNRDVEYQLLTNLIKIYAPNYARMSSIVRKPTCDAREGRANDFMETIQEFLEGDNHKACDDEGAYFQNAIYIIFRLLGFHMDVEMKFTDDVADLTIGANDYAYAIRIMRDTPADEALKQVEEKENSTEGRKLIKIGVAYDTATRKITKWKIKK